MHVGTVGAPEQTLARAPTTADGARNLMGALRLRDGDYLRQRLQGVRAGGRGGQPVPAARVAISGSYALGVAKRRVTVYRSYYGSRAGPRIGGPSMRGPRALGVREVARAELCFPPDSFREKGGNA